MLRQKANRQAGREPLSLAKSIRAYLKDKTLSCNWGELWEFTASAVGGKGFEKIDSAILAPAKSLRILNSDNVSFGGVILAFARTFFDRE